jgi:hypothetical protein
MEKGVPRGFCPLPWVHLSANTDTSLRVCCNTDHGGHVRDASGRVVYLSEVGSVREAMNQATYKELRKAMLAGERPIFCRRCYTEEDHGARSVRQIYVGHFSDVFEQAKVGTAEDGSIQPEVTYVDFSLSNNCNLKCRMCNPHSSFVLSEEFDQLKLDYSAEQAQKAHRGWDLDGNFGRIAKEVVPHLKEMLTTGGEPFLSSAHFKILQLCVESGRSHEIVLRYHSNLTLLPPRLLEIWRHFKHVELHVSLEGVGPVNEYVRYPSRWESILGNLEKLKEVRQHTKVYVEVHTCLQAISWLRQWELVKWVAEASIEFDGLFPRIPYPIWIDQPSEMTLAALPPQLRELGASRLEAELDKIAPLFADNRSPHFEFGALQSFKGALARLRATPYDPGLYSAFLKRTAKVDGFRGQNLHQFFPEFEAIPVEF